MQMKKTPEQAGHTSSTPTTTLTPARGYRTIALDPLPPTCDNSSGKLRPRSFPGGLELLPPGPHPLSPQTPICPYTT